MTMINPSLEKFPAESAIIGLLVTGYGELDITLCHLAGIALGERLVMMDALVSIENEGTRLDLISKLVRHLMVKLEYGNEFGEAIGAMRYCKGVRNQYAHAQWSEQDGQLFFAKASEIKYSENGYSDLSKRKGITLSLLQEQAAYFSYTRSNLVALEYNLMRAELDLPLTTPRQTIAFPAHMTKPPKHIPAS